MSDAVAFVGGTVRIGTGSAAEGILIERGAVALVGTRREVLRARPEGAETVELGGRLVVPGFIDAHMHLEELVRSREGVDLRGCASVDELVERASLWSARHPRGPVFGSGWDQERLARYPVRQDLERISTDRPVLLVRVCGHVAALNGRALEELRVGEVVTDPPGGRVGRDGSGRPDGRLFDRALDPLWRYLAENVRPTPESVRSTLDHAASLGLTTLSSMSAGAQEVELAQALAATGPLAVRLRFYVRPDFLYHRFPRRTGDDDPAVAVSGLKLMIDGALGARTAWLEGEYTDAPGERGLPQFDDVRLRAFLAEARHEGLPVALHAIGDRALRQALQALDAVPSVGVPRIEHASMTPPSLRALLEKVQPRLVVQPGFVTSDRWLADRIGVERARWAYAFRSLKGIGLNLAGSSDAPVEPLDPWGGMRAAVDRSDPPATSVADPESLTAEEALSLYTSGGGEALGEPRLGRLTVGSPADLVILNAGSLNEALRSTTSIRETWMKGRRTFHRAALA
ncbi:MAG: amidohydrolase [Thermoplasmata archaeon]|nr:amidohydrolase [Thermoplasmata archaeon]